MKENESITKDRIVHVLNTLWQGVVFVDRNVIKRLYRDRGEEGIPEEIRAKRALIWLNKTGDKCVQESIKTTIK